MVNEDKIPSKSYLDTLGRLRFDAKVECEVLASPQQLSRVRVLICESFVVLVEYFEVGFTRIPSVFLTGLTCSSYMNAT